MNIDYQFEIIFFYTNVKIDLMFIGNRVKFYGVEKKEI